MVAPIVAGIVAGSFLSSLAKDLVADLLRDVIGNTPRGAVDYAKVEAFKDILRQWTAEFYQSLIAKPHPQSGVDPSGFLDMVISGLLTVAKMSMIFNPEVTEEMFLEILQEGFSNAVQFSIGGAFQNILSYWRGSYGVQSGQSYNVVNAIDYLDDHTIAWLLLSSGEHVITLAFQMIFGLQQKYDNDKSLQISQVTSVVDYINRISFAWNETLRAEAERILSRTTRIAEEYYDRIIALADNLLERFISRVNEIDAEVMSHKILYDNNVIAEDTYRAVLIESILLLDSTKQSYDYFITLLDNEVGNVQTLASTTQLADIYLFDSTMASIATQYRKLIDVISYNNYTSRIITALDKINTVRTYDFATATTSPPPTSPLPPPGAPPAPNVIITPTVDFTAILSPPAKDIITTTTDNTLGMGMGETKITLDTTTGSIDITITLQLGGLERE